MKNVYVIRPSPFNRKTPSETMDLKQKLAKVTYKFCKYPGLEMIFWTLPGSQLYQELSVVEVKCEI